MGAPGAPRWSPGAPPGGGSPSPSSDGGGSGGLGDLYDLLRLERGAEAAEIRKAYHRLALRTHPDKNPGDSEAPARFQHLKRVYAVLSDPARRAAYDKTGSLEDAEDLAGEAFENLYRYYRGLYKAVTADDVAAFEREYRGSAEEARELRELYVKHAGDMDRVFAWLCCSRPEADSHRFCDALEAAVAAGEVPEFPPFRAWAAQVRRRPAPKKDPLQPGASPLPGAAGNGKGRGQGQGKGAGATGGGAALSLAEQIRGKQAGRAESLLASLEAKYGGGKGKKKEKKKRGGPGGAEISEEDFARAAARLQKKRKSK